MRMRKRLATLLAIVMTVATCAWADAPFRNHRYDGFKTLPAVNNNDVVFIGNSITNMFNWWEALGSNQRIKGRGTSGAVTQEVLDNLESMIAGQPSKVFLMIGTNDLGTAGINEPVYVFNQIKTIITRIRKESPATQIYCQSILPSGLRDAAKIRKTNELVSAWITEKADNQVTYVNLYPLLDNGDGTIANTQNNGTSANSYDNLHLTALGYYKWLKEIEKYLPEDCRCQIPEGIQTLGSGLGGSPGMRSTYFGALPVKESDILIIGDEMIHGCEWHELLGADFKDRGIGWGYSGVNIANISAELNVIFGGNEGKVVKQTPKAICLYAGVADCNADNYAAATVQANYKALVDGIRAKVSAQTPIFLMTLAPHPTAANNNKAKELNTYMKTLADADENLHIIDLYQAAMNGSARQESYFMGTNNAYISGLGYVAFANAIKTSVNSVMKTDYTCISMTEAQNNLTRFNTRKTIGDATNQYALVDAYVGTGIGQYPEAAVNAYKSAIEPAFTALQNLVPSTSVDFAAAKATLVQSLNPVTAAAVNGKQFAFSTPNRGSLYAYTDGQGLNATGSNPGYKNYRWILESRNDGTFNIKNAAKDVYMNPSAAHDSQIKMSAQVPSAGWKLEYSDALGLYIIKSGTNCELNATTKEGYPIYNWHNTSTATNRSDTGCQWQVEDVTEDPVIPNPDPINVVKGEVQEGAATLVDGHIYTITNRQQGGFYPLYVTDGLQVGEKNALAGKSYGNRAQFRAIKKGDKWAFQNIYTEQYLIWRGGSQGYNNNKGVLDEYNSTYCDFTITPATSVTAVTNGKLITGKRSNGTENGTFTQNADGTWNAWRDPSVDYTAQHTNVYTFGDVTNGYDGEVEKEPLLVAGRVYSIKALFADGKSYFVYDNGTQAAAAQKMPEDLSGYWMYTADGKFKNFKTPTRYLAANAGQTGLSVNTSGAVFTVSDGLGAGTVALMDASYSYAVKYDGTVAGGRYSDKRRCNAGGNGNWTTDFVLEQFDPTESFMSQSFETANWLRLSNGNFNNYVMASKGANVNNGTAPADASSSNQLFAFVGNTTDGFYIYNKELGSAYTLTSANTNNATPSTWQKNATNPTKWYLVDTYAGAAEKPGYVITTNKNSGQGLNMYGGQGGDAKYYAATDGGTHWQISIVDTNPTVIHYAIVGDKNFDDANQWVGQLKIQKGSFTSQSLLTKDIDGTTFNAYLPKTSDEAILTNYALHGWKYSCENRNGEFYVTYTADTETEFRYLGFRPDAQWYRIPAIVKASNGDLISIYDWRVCHSDVGFGEVDQHMRISKDNGRTWQEEVKIADGKGNGKVFGAAFGDPALIADRESNNVTLVTVSGTTAYPYATGTDHNLISVQFSKDNGKTWGTPQDITTQFWGKAGAIFADAATEDASTTFAYSGFFGSGKILQSRQVKVGDYYRIYAAMLCRGKNVKGAYVVYSDDLGHTWKLLGGNNTIQAAPGSDEPKVEELPNGDIVLSCRKSYGRLFNIWKWKTLPTKENAMGSGAWGSVVESNQQTGGISVGANSCNGEILYVECQKADGTPAKLMLQSLPSANDRSGVEIWYKDITDPSTYTSSAVFAQNWTRGLRVSPQSPVGFSAYSTMCLQQDGRIGFLFEEGPATYCIVYAPLSIDKITDNKYTKAIIPFGDVNQDGKVNTDDVDYLARAILNQEETTEYCDVDHNSKVNIADLSTLVKILIEK